MYLRPKRKTVRTAREPRQRVVARIGKEPGLDARARNVREIRDLLSGETWPTGDAPLRLTVPAGCFRLLAFSL